MHDEIAFLNVTMTKTNLIHPEKKKKKKILRGLHREINYIVRAQLCFLNESNDRDYFSKREFLPHAAHAGRKIPFFLRVTSHHWISMDNNDSINSRAIFYLYFTSHHFPRND